MTAITEHKLIRTQASGQGRDQSAARSYRSTWRLIGAKYSEEGFRAAEQYLRANSTLPYYGRAWRFGGETDDTATCSELEISHVPGADPDSGVLEVNATFTTTDPNKPKEERPNNTDGKLTDDPLKWQQECDVSWSQSTVAIDEAIFRGFNQPINNRRFRLGMVGPIKNSAGQVMDLQHLRESDFQVLRFTQNVPRWQNAIAAGWIGAVNSAFFNLRLPQIVFNGVFAERTLKVRNYGGSFAITNGVKHWRRNIELMYNPETWLLKVFDTGTHQLLDVGDKRQDGTTISTDDLVDGEPVTEAMQDETGYPLALPVFLDGKGKRLKDGRPPVLMTYQVYKREKNFALLGL